MRLIALAALFMLALVSLLAACGPTSTGELVRLNQPACDREVQLEGRQDFRTTRQKLPGFMLP